MKNSNANTGLSLPLILFLIFLTLKLTGNIDWSWWWVTSPLWIPFVTVVGFILLLISIVLIFMILALSFGMSVDDIKEKLNNLKGN
jgi:hypothetical protein